MILIWPCFSGYLRSGESGDPAAYHLLWVDQDQTPRGGSKEHSSYVALISA